jgi:uncharacterized membrane protein YphA (DoxX/SURF4 family)
LDVLPYQLRKFDKLIADQRPILLKWGVCAGVLAGMALCPRLWISSRGFPTIPVFPALPDLPGSLTVLLTVALILSILATAVLPRPTPAIIGLLGSAAILVLFDINRLQPWFYLYLLLFGALLTKPIPIGGFILASVYAWSGLQKMNASFAELVFPRLVHPLGLSHTGWLWLLAPIVETSIGVLLFIPKTRKVALIAALGMHAFLVFALGPFGLDANSVVWPWIIFMPALAIVIFYRNPDPIISLAWQSGFGKAAILLTGLMPALSFFGLWDQYLSASLYSGKPTEAVILLNDQGVAQLPTDIEAKVKRQDDRIGLEVVNWGMDELNVPPYPEKRVYRALASKLHRMGVSKSNMMLAVAEQRSLTDSKAHVSIEAIP